MHQDDLRSYGRRKGHRLRPSRERLLAELLPRFCVDLADPPPDNWTDFFGQNYREVWLEIGFGNGEHLAAQASNNPDIGFVGAEPFINGVANFLGLVDANGLSNVRVIDDDVRPFLDWIGRSDGRCLLDRVFILFPDPWPKKKHKKRRLISVPMLERLAGVMRQDAVITIASDIGDYVRTSLLAVQQHAGFEWTAWGAQDWRERPEDWIETRYERKALDAGRRCSYLSIRKTI